MIIDINKIRARAKIRLMESPSEKKLSVSAAKPAKRSALPDMLRTLFGALILIALTIAGAYLIWTLASQSARYVEIQADKKDAPQAPAYDKSATYEITYKPASK
ncbi:MAG: hypothetical protein IKS15_05580 [Opitutales bacterium]|nr:hypothetical protein [Opitutales bacterium]